MEAASHPSSKAPEMRPRSGAMRHAVSANSEVGLLCGVVGHDTRKRRRRFGLLALCMLGSAAFLHCGFRQDEVECEEAVHHLSECCAGFDPMKFKCTYDNSCGAATLTDLPTGQSE